MPLKVGVLMGGPSEERDVSISTGKAVINACQSNGFKTTPFEFHEDYEKFLFGLKQQDIIFNALHGGIGENGKIQAWMDHHGIKYTGSGSTASALCMDKHKSKKVAIDNHVRTPKWIILNDQNHIPDFELPFVVKPNDQGSTVGLSIVKEKHQYTPAVIEAFKHGDSVLVEAYIEGRELTVTFLGDSVYPIVEIKPSHELYDYECKYTAGLSEYICPAELPQDVELDMQTATKTMFNALGCDIYARADFLLDKSNKAYFLEVNTLPGMTDTSLVPKSVNAMGMSFESLVKQIIELSL